MDRGKLGGVKSQNLYCPNGFEHDEATPRPLPTCSKRMHDRAKRCGTRLALGAKKHYPA